MALKALDIFKLTPKKNCKDCGFPTCMAFSMKVASGAVEVSKCPHMSDDAIAKLSEATAPLMRALKVGSGTSEYELGAETVLFRHEKTLVNRNRYAVAFDDSMTNEQIDFKIANIKAVNYIRIGEEMKAEMIVLEYRDNKEGFLNLVNRVNESGLDVTHIIVCEDVDIAKEAIERGADVTLITGPTNLTPPQNLKKLVKIESAKDMYEAVLENLDENDVVIKSAAVADYKPKNYSNKKIKKSDDDLVIELDRNKDIAQEIGKIKNNKILVGFAAETNDLIENASLKIKKKNLDFLVANDLTKEGAGFGVDTNIVKIIDKEGNITEYPKMKKEEVANIILDKIKELLSV